MCSGRGGMQCRCRLRRRWHGDCRWRCRQRSPRNTSLPPAHPALPALPACLPALQEGLESIAFQNVGCSVHGCAALEELMANSGRLRRLHLYNNMSGCEGAASIAR